VNASKSVDTTRLNRQNLLPMIREFFIALIQAGLPVGLVAYGLVWWALRNDYLGEARTTREIEQESRLRAKDKKARKQVDPVHRKWLSLGGGFYGVVAVLTLLHIELGEVRDFIAGFDGVGPFLDRLSVGMLVGLIIETIRNTIAALTWPVYWLGEISSSRLWVWIIAAYAGYWAGSSLASNYYRGRS
jgi:hypothetical protein